MTVLDKEAARPVASPTSASRIEALDWTKGALIICMVIYHAINYSAFRPYAFRILAFLPPSFILITGFLVGQVYAAKYDPRTWKPYLRLAARGIKLLLVFTLLNFAYCIGLEHSVVNGWDEFTLRSGAIFLSGNGREGVFEVLLPIAYFLLLAPVLLRLRTFADSLIAVAAAAAFLLSLCLEMSGRPLKNLEFLSVGIIGMAFGLVPMPTIDRFAARWVPVVSLYLLYRLCSWVFGENYAVQLFAAAVTVLLLYCCALHLSTSSPSGREMTVLGKYSLLGYLAQIIILRGLVKLAGGKPAHIAGVAGMFVMATALTLLVVKVTHVLRQRNRVVAEVYKTVFA